MAALGSTKDRTATGFAGTDTVRLPNGDAFACAAGDTILGAGLRAGMGLPHECLSGGCGKCYFDLLEGEVEELWTDAPGLSAKARQRGRRLACQTRPLGDCAIKITPAPAYVPPIRPIRSPGRVTGRRMIGPDMLELTIGTERPANFLAGQFCLFSLAGVAGRRAYSMSNLPNAEGHWQFIIRRVPGGEGTRLIFGEFEPGTAIELDGPYGNAYLRPEIRRDIICIAGGSGLSPILSIARAAARDERLQGRHISVFYGGRGPADICAPLYWESDPMLAARTELHSAISDPAAQDAHLWTGHRGYIHEVVEMVAHERLADCEFYVCGPARMVEAVQGLILARGVPRERLHFDSFY